VIDPLDIREKAFRLAVDVASFTADNTMRAATDMVREASDNQAFLTALQNDPRTALLTLAQCMESTMTQPPSHP
jgi:hypothetical protein